MTREEYNTNRKPQPQIEEKLCGWNFCKSCINARTAHGMPIPELKSHPSHSPYFRYLNPERRASHKFYNQD